jgi:hypothetical protein
VSELEDLVREVQTGLPGIFEQIGWAEDEIEAAQRRHPRQRDLLWHAFGLLTPGADRKWGTEFVARSHFRELLTRVSSGHDTRPGTDAEMVVVISQTSGLAPINTAGAGLYFRLWHRAGFPDLGVDNRAHYEALEHGPINKMERDLRQKLAQKDRRLGEIKCSGRHNAKLVNCRFAISDKKDAGQENG